MGNTGVVIVVLVVVLVVVVGAAVGVGFVLRGRMSGAPRRAADAVYDLGAAEALRRDVAGALTRRVAPNVARPGGIVMRGRVAKQFATLGQTLVVRADPAVVADLTGPAVLASKGKFAPATHLEPGEVAAWEAESIFGPFPRLVVRESPLGIGAVEVGVVRLRVSLRVPQGSTFANRGLTAAREALRAAGLPLVDQVREFVPGPDIRADGDGTWTVGEFVAVSPPPR